MDNQMNQSTKEKLMKVVMIFFIVISIFYIVRIFQGFREYSYIGKANNSANTITVTGKGEVSAAPDVATFSVTVTETAKTTKVAQDLATKKSNAVLAAVKAAGVADKDVQTSGYNINPKYEYSNGICTRDGYCPPGRQTITGYEVSESLTVKVRKIDDSSAILATVGGLNPAYLGNLNLTIDKPEALKDDARAKAIDEAKAKASKLAKDLGVSLDHIVTFSESGDGYYPPVMYASMKSMDAAGGSVASPTPEIATGENKITSNVTITYELR